MKQYEQQPELHETYFNILLNVRARYIDFVNFAMEHSEDEVIDLPIETGVHTISGMQPERGNHIVITNAPKFGSEGRLELLRLVVSVVDEFADEAVVWFTSCGVHLSMFDKTGQQVDAIRDTTQESGWRWDAFTPPIGTMETGEQKLVLHMSNSALTVSEEMIAFGSLYGTATNWWDHLEVDVDPNDYGIIGNAEAISTAMEAAEIETVWSNGHAIWSFLYRRWIPMGVDSTK